MSSKCTQCDLCLFQLYHAQRNDYRKNIQAQVQLMHSKYSNCVHWEGKLQFFCVWSCVIVVDRMASLNLVTWLELQFFVFRCSSIEYVIFFASIYKSYICDSQFNWVLVCEKIIKMHENTVRLNLFRFIQIFWEQIIWGRMEMSKMQFVDARWDESHQKMA